MGKPGNSKAKGSSVNNRNIAKTRSESINSLQDVISKRNKEIEEVNQFYKEHKGMPKSVLQEEVNRLENQKERYERRIKQLQAMTDEEYIANPYSYEW